ELWSRNTETERLLAHPETAPLGSPYLETLWQQAQNSYVAIEIRDTSGLAVFGDSSETARDDEGARWIVPIVDPVTHDQRGELVMRPVTHRIVPPELAGIAFGRSGRTVVVDIASRRVIGGAAAPSDSLLLAALPVTRAASTFSYDRGDSARIGAVVPLGIDGWAIASTTALAEFSSVF